MGSPTCDDGAWALLHREAAKLETLGFDAACSHAQMPDVVKTFDPILLGLGTSLQKTDTG